MIENGFQYSVIVAGAGAVLQEKFTPSVLDKLGPKSRRIIFDIDPQRILDSETKIRSSNLLIADGELAPFNIRGDGKDFVGVVTTPGHLGVVFSLIQSGVNNFIVEKPLVANVSELDKLQEILRANPDVKVYPLDFYVQKAAPLLVLTSAIKPEDPRFNWVVMSDDSEVNIKLCGSFKEYIGKIEGIGVTIFEGGSLGMPDIDKRKWLEGDNVRGGMLLDLGTHALAPLFAAGVLSPDSIKVESAFREVLGEDRKSFVRAGVGQAEMRAGALLTANIGDRTIPVFLDVGKTFHDGGIWKLVIRGSKGEISFGLRTGQRLTVEPKEGPCFQLKLRSQDPYEMAFQEARMCFEGYEGFDGNLNAMLGSIKTIDKIKEASNK